MKNNKYLVFLGIIVLFVIVLFVVTRIFPIILAQMDGINLWNFFPIFVFIGLFVMILILYFSNDDIKSTYNTKKINELEKTTEQDFEYNKK